MRCISERKLALECYLKTKINTQLQGWVNTDSWTGSSGSSPRICFAGWTPEVTEMPHHDKSSKHWLKLQTSSILPRERCLSLLPVWDHGAEMAKWVCQGLGDFLLSTVVFKCWDSHEQKVIGQGSCQDPLPIPVPAPQRQLQSQVALWKEPRVIPHHSHCPPPCPEGELLIYFPWKISLRSHLCSEGLQSLITQLWRFQVTFPACPYSCTLPWVPVSLPLVFSPGGAHWPSLATFLSSIPHPLSFQQPPPVAGPSAWSLLCPCWVSQSLQKSRTEGDSGIFR